MPSRSFAEIMNSDRVLLGTWAQIASEEIIDMLGAAGFDFAIVDCEHGAFGIDMACKLIRACNANNLSPLVRVACNDRTLIGQALDAGASAIVVPAISSAEDAAKAVAAARFAPSGARGACPCVRAGGHFIEEWQSYAAQQEATPRIVSLVETKEGVADIERIVATPGLLAIMAGPFDLAVSLGLTGDYRHQTVQTALDQVIDAARSAGLPLIMPVFHPEPIEARRQQERWLGKGVRVFAVGTDKIFFHQAARTYEKVLRQ